MASKPFSLEQIITMLQEAEVLLNHSNPIDEVLRKMKSILLMRYKLQASIGTRIGKT